MAYRDQDDPYATGETPAYRRTERDPQRQIMVRRMIALGIGVLIVVLLVLAVRGCLDARKERGFENYVSDLNSVTGQSNQVSTDFFTRLGEPKNLSELDFKTEVNADAGSAEGLVNQLDGIDVPGELEEAQDELVLSFQLRRDGLTGIAEEISTALGEDDRGDAIERIAGYMRYFLASDVLFERSRAEIQEVLKEEEIAEKVTSSVFLPEPIERWLDPVQLSSTLAAVSGGDETSGGIHGLALAQTTIKPGNVVLDPGAPATIGGGGPFEIEVQAENQGDSEETDVSVTYELSGGAETISGEGTIDSIEAAEIGKTTIEIEPDPPLGQELSLEVSIVPVPEEQISDNNTATYAVTFE